MENLADISEPKFCQMSKRSINSISHLFIQVSMREKQFLKFNFPSFYSGFNGRKAISPIEIE